MSRIAALRLIFAGFAVAAIDVFVQYVEVAEWRWRDGLALLFAFGLILVGLYCYLAKRISDDRSR